MNSVAVAIDLVLALILRAQQVSMVIAQARAEGRDSLTPEETAALDAQYAAARSELQAAIDKARQ